jgi:agmatinase
MRPYDTAVDPFEKLAVIDYGDCFFDFGRPEEVPAAIEAHASSIIDAGPGLLTLGGDHFIAWPLLKAHAKKHGKPLSLLHFDAHSDTWQDEEGRVDHGTMFWHAAKEGLVDPAHSVQIGLRTTNDDTLGFNILDGPWVHENGIDAVVRETKKHLGDRPVYLSFDIDCLDPSYAPGTGTPVCGGLTTHQAIQIIRGLIGINLIGMDIVEVAPVYDVGEITALAGATLAVEMINTYAHRPAS